MPNLTTIAIAVTILYLIFGVVTKATKWIFRIAMAIIIFSLIIHGYDAFEKKFISFDTGSEIATDAAQSAGSGIHDYAVNSSEHKRDSSEIKQEDANDNGDGGKDGR